MSPMGQLESKDAMQTLIRKFLDAEYDCTRRETFESIQIEIARRSQKPAARGSCSTS